MYSIYIYTSLDATSITYSQKESLTRQKDVKQVSEMLERLSKTTSWANPCRGFTCFSSVDFKWNPSIPPFFGDPNLQSTGHVWWILSMFDPSISRTWFLGLYTEVYWSELFLTLDIWGRKRLITLSDSRIWLFPQMDARSCRCQVNFFCRVSEKNGCDMSLCKHGTHTNIASSNG
jgi:hypothetical protein